MVKDRRAPWGGGGNGAARRTRFTASRSSSAEPEERASLTEATRQPLARDAPLDLTGIIGRRRSARRLLLACAGGCRLCGTAAA
jgi:hypothetical protein